jgi:NADH/NAD ratio-sensing transcriptional regulator Rex
MVQALARAGVKAILNLTPVPLLASARMVIEQADTGSQLLRLLSRLGSTEKAEAR